MITTDIKQGPSRQTLIESLDRHNSGNQTQVRFVTKDNLVFVGSIESLTHEDGSGNSFLFTGVFGGVRLNGYYQTHSRLGWIEVKPAGAIMG